MGSSISLVLPHLYLGSAEEIDDPKFFEKFSIKHVVSVSRCRPHPEFCLNVLHINEIDNKNTDLLQYWEQTTIFIHKAREAEENVFIHCKQGISRSSSTVLAYIIACCDLSLLEPSKRSIQDKLKAYGENQAFVSAFGYLRKCRNIINPNEGFLEQLFQWNYSHHNQVSEYVQIRDRNCIEHRESFIQKIIFEVNFFDIITQAVEVDICVSLVKMRKILYDKAKQIFCNIEKDWREFEYFLVMDGVKHDIIYKRKSLFVFANDCKVIHYFEKDKSLLVASDFVSYFGINKGEEKDDHNICQDETNKSSTFGYILRPQYEAQIEYYTNPIPAGSPSEDESPDDLPALGHLKKTIYK